MNNLNIYAQAEKWMDEYTVKEAGIAVHSRKQVTYPEVTGYYIPTLLRWGYREKALQFAKWLCDHQREDGAWGDPDYNQPYVFDTAQVLKGLIAVRELLPEAEEALRKGADWILSNIQPDGRLTTPDKQAWGNSKACSELIHLYCLSPLVEYADLTGEEKYKSEAFRVLKYYKTNHYEEIMNFRLLSHFYAYVMEALVDMGEVEMAREAMEKVALLQNKKGAVPAYYDVKWVCSTGLFQFALVWYRLGEIEKGNRAFSYACSLQNESGGWYGGYTTQKFAKWHKEKGIPNYFPESEISWAVKYFLDALYYKCEAEFEAEAPRFMEHIDKEDGRYQFVLNEVIQVPGAKVLDAGCGKGRYIKNLLGDVQGIQLYATDISSSVMQNIPETVEKRKGTLTCLPFGEDEFDIVYTCEALEHAVNIKNVVRELLRVTKTGGKILIVDKPSEMLGRMQIDAWEQWIDTKVLAEVVGGAGKVKRFENLAYENGKKDGLFDGWIIEKGGRI